MIIYFMIIYLLGIHEGETSRMENIVALLHSWSPSPSFPLHNALDQVALQRNVPHDVS